MLSLGQRIDMFSRSCKYAIRAVLYLSTSLEPNEKVGVKKMAEDLDLPQHYLAKILQQLSRHGHISSAKGPRGGFYLSEENLQCPLREVIETIDGRDVFDGCIIGLPSCSDMNPCPLHDLAKEHKSRLNAILNSTNIRDLSAEIVRHGLII